MSANPFDMHAVVDAEEIDDAEEVGDAGPHDADDVADRADMGGVDASSWVDDDPPAWPDTCLAPDGHWYVVTYGQPQWEIHADDCVRCERDNAEYHPGRD